MPDNAKHTADGRRIQPMIVCLVLLVLSAWVCGAQNGPAFRDATSELISGLGNGAACWADLDNDGWTDLCAGGTVWINNGGKGFSRLMDGVGAAVAADFDNDGFVDLFSWSSLKVFRNEAGESFSPIEMPELPKCASRGASWGDFNGDGFVDLFVGGYEVWNPSVTYPDMILMNVDGKGFELAWSEVRYRARGVTACDFDEDGDLDVYVSNYRLQPNLLWRNDGTGVFEEIAGAANAIATSAGFGGGHAIGAAWGDFDEDGHIDLFAGNFAHRDSRGDQPKSRFLRNQGPEKGYVFDDRGTCGVYYQESYASPTAGDYDNDGDLDLFFTTVYGTASFGKKNHPVLYRNDGGFAFADASASTKVSGLPSTYQAAWADFDNDGDLDLVSAGRLFVNEGTGNHWLKVLVHGDGSAIDWSAIGAQVRIELPGKTLTRQVEAGTGEGNQNDLVLHFGLGEHAAPVNLDIRWPNGTMQTVPSVEVDRLVAVRFDSTP